MPFTQNGRHYSTRVSRFCKQCQIETLQSCTWVKYRAPKEPTVPAALLRTRQWICERCSIAEEEAKLVYEPTDKLRLINRLLRLAEDYDYLKVSVASKPNEIIVRIQTPDFDPSELRSIQDKQRLTGFVNVAELLKLQKAGFRGSRDVPSKPQPLDARTIKDRAKQSVFNGATYLT